MGNVEGANGRAIVKEHGEKVGRSGVDIVNLSFACGISDGEPPPAIGTAIDLLDPEVVVVAAAGNHGEAQPIDIGGQSVEITTRPAGPPRYLVSSQ